MIILQYEYLNNYRYYHIPDRYKMRLKSKIMGMMISVYPFCYNLRTLSYSQ